MHATYPSDWQGRYTDRRYALTDPVLVAGHIRMVPFAWSGLNWQTAEAQRMLQEAWLFGIPPNGVTVPLHIGDGMGYCVSAVADKDESRWAEWTHAHLPAFILFAHYLVDRIERDTAGKRPVLQNPLSPREVDALTYLGRGYSRSQLAAVLSISEHTVRAYIESARHKLGGLNTTHAVARAVQMGVIDLEGAQLATDPMQGRAMAGE